METNLSRKLEKYEEEGKIGTQEYRSLKELLDKVLVALKHGVQLNRKHGWKRKSPAISNYVLDILRMSHEDIGHAEKHKKIYHQYIIL